MSTQRGRLDLLLCGVLIALMSSWLGPVSALAQNTAENIRKQVKAEFSFEETAPEEMDVAALTDKGRRCLESGLVNWRHAETEHFTVHYERKDFARHVARLAEFLYAYMAEELGVTEDRVKGRSHIFIFNNARRWDEFTETISGLGEWAFSFVHGPDMFLQRAGARHESSEIVAHEMVHVILFRFYGRPPPLWLNEGLAQWYEEFGYGAYKGTGKSKKAPFRPLKKWCPIREMMAEVGYPRTHEEVELFYTTSKYLTGFLMLEYPPEKMNAFVAALTSGMPLEQALCDIYRIGDVNYLVRDFERFAH